jgi:hypothetical protein
MVTGVIQLAKSGLPERATQVSCAAGPKTP